MPLDRFSEDDICHLSSFMHIIAHWLIGFSSYVFLDIICLMRHLTFVVSLRSQLLKKIADRIKKITINLKKK